MDVLVSEGRTGRTNVGIDSSGILRGKVLETRRADFSTAATVLKATEASNASTTDDRTLVLGDEDGRIHFTTIENARVRPRASVAQVTFASR